MNVIWILNSILMYLKHFAHLTISYDLQLTSSLQRCDSVWRICSMRYCRSIWIVSIQLRIYVIIRLAAASSCCPNNGVHSTRQEPTIINRSMLRNRSMSEIFFFHRILQSWKISILRISKFWIAKLSSHAHVACIHFNSIGQIRCERAHTIWCLVGIWFDCKWLAALKWP